MGDILPNFHLGPSLQRRRKRALRPCPDSPARRPRPLFMDEVNIVRSLTLLFTLQFEVHIVCVFSVILGRTIF